MVREVITISVGQGGVQLGNDVWEQYCTEHSIECDGKRNANADSDEDGFTTFFQESTAGQYVPRTVCVDLDPMVISDVKRGKRQEMYNHDDLISGVEDAANNFSRGYYTVGKDYLDQVLERMRHLADNSEQLQGFILQHAMGGGTGSGMGALIAERLAINYRKTTNLAFSIYPSASQSTCIVEPYNACMGTSNMLEFCDISIVLDNEALYGICRKQLNLKRPDYGNLNRIVAKVASSMTAALRFPGELNVDMSDFTTNLVPFPRLHFMTTSLAPIISQENVHTEAIDARTATNQCVNPDNFLVNYPDFDVSTDLYMAISLTYRGKVSANNATAAIRWLKTQKDKVNFVPWCPTGFKLGINEHAPPVVDGDDLAFTPMSAAMVSNNSAVRHVFSKRICKKWDMMYSQRAYVHWYVGEGLEEGELYGCREELAFLLEDYQNVLMEEELSENSADSF